MREAVERAETRERVQCVAGSCFLSAISTGTTLGGGAVTLVCGLATLGGGSDTLGVGTGRVGGLAGVVVTGGTGDMAGGVMFGLGIQLVKIPRRF